MIDSTDIFDRRPPNEPVNSASPAIVPVDTGEIARRALQTPRTAMSLSVEQTRALAFAYLLLADLLDPSFEVVAAVEACADDKTASPEQRARVRQAIRSLKTALGAFEPVEIGDEIS